MIVFKVLQRFLCAKACWSSSRPSFCFFGLAGVPAGLFFDFSGLLEFQQGCFLIFWACWSSSRAVFCFFGLLEFQQAIFLIFRACWSSSRAVFCFFELAGVPARLQRHDVFRALSFSEHQTAPVSVLSLFGLYQAQGLCLFCEPGHIFGVKTAQNEHTFRVHEPRKGR